MITEPLRVGDEIVLKNISGVVYERWRITEFKARIALAGYYVYAAKLHGEGTPVSQYFGRVDSNRVPDGWSERFVLERPAKHETPSDTSDWRTWRDTGLEPGHCVCRIPRELCEFHR